MKVLGILMAGFGFLLYALFILMMLGMLYACFGTVHIYFGTVGVVLCVLTGIATVVPVTFVALLIHGQWSDMGILVLSLMLIAGIHLLAKAMLARNSSK